MISEVCIPSTSVYLTCIQEPSRRRWGCRWSRPSKMYTTNGENKEGEDYRALYCGCLPILLQAFSGNIFSSQGGYGDPAEHRNTKISGWDICLSLKDISWVESTRYYNLMWICSCFQEGNNFSGQRFNPSTAAYYSREVKRSTQTLPQNHQYAPCMQHRLNRLCWKSNRYR